MARSTKKVLAIADLHCGHKGGLTPPDWQLRSTKASEGKHTKFAKLEQETWNWYCKTLDEIGPVDVTITLGDLIDGTGRRSGGTEQITTDMNVQTEIALEALSQIDTDQIVMVSGTPYHVGDSTDFEEVLASKLGGVKIGDHEWVDVNGVVFDCKHNVPDNSSIYGAGSALSKERLFNAIWATEGGQPRADVLLRAHVHQFNYTGACHNGKPFVAMTLPCLQGSSRYGARMCSYHTDLGMVEFTVDGNGEWTWKAHVARLQSASAKALVL